MNTNIQSYQQYYQENQYLLSPFSPIDNTTSDRYHTDLILQNNKEKYQQLLKENEGVFISQWLYNQSFQQSLTSYLTYRSRPVDIVEDPLDIFDYDRLVFMLFAHLASMSPINEREVFESITLLRLPSLISLGAIMGDSNLATFRKIFYQFHSKRPSLSNEYETTISETQMTLEQLYQSMDDSISTTLGMPKSKYLTGTPTQQKPRTKTGSGIRAVNLKAKKVKDSLAPTTESPQLTNIFSFSDSLEFALDISYFLSILTAVSDSYFSSGESLSDIGQAYLKCISLLYELIIPLFARGLSTFSTAEDQGNWKQMLTLARNRILQSLLMTMVFTCHHFHIPVRPNEIQSFSWLSDQSVEISRPSFPFHVPWSEIIFQMISGEFLKASEGTLFGDLMKVYPQTTRNFLQKIFENEDEEKKSYLLNIIQASAIPTSSVKRIPQNQTLAAAAESKSEVSQAPLYSIPTAQSLIQDVKAIFPDYGEFFISCVLEAYGQNPERAIDALLSDNLPPNLQRMDRTTKSAWMGKASTDSKTAVSRKGNDIQYSLELSEKDKAIQKMRIRQMEKREEEDSRLMSLQMEYGDDYDDQYDEGGLKPSHNWQEEREKILRVNKLLLSEEAEDAYWQDMRNTNQPGIRKVVDEEEEEEEEGNPQEDEGKKQVETKTESKQVTKTAPGGDSSRSTKTKINQKLPLKTDSPKGNPKKHPVVDIRTQNNVQRKPQKKTYDKHHQKDKNIRKFGGFMS